MRRLLSGCYGKVEADSYFMYFYQQRRLHFAGSRGAQLPNGLSRSPLAFLEVDADGFALGLADEAG
jgi:hypothetical protein